MDKYAGNNPVNFVDPSGLALTQPYLLNATKRPQPTTGSGYSTQCVAAGLTAAGSVLTLAGAVVAAGAAGPAAAGVALGLGGNSLTALGATIYLGVDC